ncbi:2-hydroxyhepta-2,4-diene-1,7-dioate isomerase [Burkholderia sp. ABCPW 11]|uniref:fumarylacetoacetate hydrolase family protein n=1 Tax=Burkholderia sp. ABCPW 11 TaxID=1637859 RepID=UPI00075E58D6|nr:fumarylacetoacetate hydrolase family protein [Burkholderia sp. ABCPW 11]KVD46821.1 2-hydroxyhepta-2,4-diene-1,7-dioate isomerase [Burkholderia sp. ABCPW 11]
MFSVTDHLLHVEGDPLPRDIDAHAVSMLLASGVACRPPVSGAVYGTLLNDRAALDALGDAMHAAPYKAPPKAPILYLKPRNTLAGHRARVEVPVDASGIEVGASLGIVIGRTATRVSAEHALDFVAGYVIVADLSIPHSSVYRPSVRFRARDRFCVIGPAVVAKRHVTNPDSIAIRVEIPGKPAFEASTATALRGVSQLVADVTDFMTLAAGDVITLGVPHATPIAHAGEEATITFDGFAPLVVSFAGAPQQNGESE